MSAQGVNERMINVHYYYYYVEVTQVGNLSLNAVGRNRGKLGIKGGGGGGGVAGGEGKLQALVYDILPSTTAVFSYVIGSWTAARR